MGRIASLVTSVAAEETPIKKEIGAFIKMISIFAVILGIVLSIPHGVLYKGENCFISVIDRLFILLMKASSDPSKHLL